MNKSLCGIRMFLIAASGILFGCSKAPVKAPSIDPVAAAELAIQEYDTDADGKISGSEAKSSALDAEAGWDSDGDGAISAAEIQSRLERYEQLKPGLQTISCTVRYRDDYLHNAHVVFEPEAFLGAAVVMAEGTTDGYGQTEIVAPSILKEDPTLRGMRAGLYKVRITHPELNIPKKYNEDTTLFFEISPMDNLVMPAFHLR